MDRAAKRTADGNRSGWQQRRWNELTEALERRMLLSAAAHSATVDLLASSHQTLFVENRGQFTDPSVRYALLSRRANVLMTDQGPIFQVFNRQGDDDSAIAEQFSAAFDGANQTRPQGLARATGRFNYYVGEQSRWRTNVPGYRKIAYKDLYDGIDLYTWGRGSGLKYEFHVAPGADYRQVQISYSGIQGLSIDGKGRLHIKTETGELIDNAPFVYQVVNGKRVKVAASFKLLDNDTYSFELRGAYDTNRQLIIDPDIGWSTFLGGANTDSATEIAIDGSGNVVVTGATQSSDFPAVSAYDASFNADWDVFVTKFDGEGRLLWSTFLGGFGEDLGHGVVADGSGNIIVVGDTRSSNFPVLTPFQGTLRGSRDAFVTKFRSNGQLSWSSYLGGSGTEYGRAVGIDAANNIYLTGETESSNFPNTGGFDTTLSGFNDAYVTKITSAGAIAWSSYLGGSDTEFGYGIAVDNTGIVTVVGETTSTDLATAGAADTTFNGVSDAFVARVDASAHLVWATYHGGTGADSAQDVALTTGGACIIVGNTSSIDLPTTGGFDTSYNGGTDALVASFLASGSLSWSSYLGGGGEDSGMGIDIDTSNEIYLTGATNSQDFPTQRGFDTTFGGLSDAYITAITTGVAIDFSSYLGGSSDDGGQGIAVDSARNPIIAGFTSSANFPAVNAYDDAINGGTDVFVAKIVPSETATVPAAPTECTAVAVSQTRIDVSWTDNSENELGFLVERATGGGAFTQIAMVLRNTTRYSDTGLLPDTRYRYRVRAFNASGESGYSNVAIATTKTAFMNAPSGLRARPYSSKQIDLTWQDNSNNETGFQLWRRTGLGGAYSLIRTLAANATEYSDFASLLPDTEYIYQVRAINQFEVSSFSDEASATTFFDGYIVAPSGLKAAVAQNGDIDLRWSDNSDNETAFSIERRLANSSDWAEIDTVGPNVNQYHDSSTIAGITYYYRVRGLNAAGYSRYSNPAASNPKEALAAPAQLDALAGANGRIVLTWRDMSTGESQFIIERRYGSSGTWNVIRRVSANTASYTDRGLPPLTRYCYRIRGTDGYGFGEYSREVSEKTLPLLTSPPTSPTGLKTYAASPTSVKLYWRDRSADETNFLIERAAGAAGPFAVVGTVGADVRIYVDKNLSPETTYYYRVRSVRGAFRSTPTAVEAGTTLPIPAAVSISATQLTPGSEGEIAGLFAVRRKGSTTQALTITYEILGTATNGLDYQTLTGTVTIAAGQSTALISINSFVDQLVEGDEIVTLRLLKDAAYRISPTMASASVTIADAPPP